MILLRQKSCLLLLPLLISLASISQYRVRKVQHNENRDLTFPILIDGNKAAAKKINEYMQTDFFETTTSKTPESRLFEEARFIDDNARSQTGYTSISYKIEINNTKLFSIIFEVEGMGAYPTAYKKYYSFNSKNGELLTADSLFTTEGIANIKRILVDRRTKDINAWIKNLKEANEDAFGEDSSFIVERFSACNSSAHENNMYIGKEKVKFYKEDCFPHGAAPYETNLNIEFTFKELEKYLSGSGKRILFTK